MFKQFENFKNVSPGIEVTKNISFIEKQIQVKPKRLVKQM